jgi:RNA polymerase sigma-70 factor (ECF subfamily)
LHCRVPEAHIEDALQDVFVIAYRHLPNLDTSRPIRNWLFGVSRKVASEYRRGKRKGTRQLNVVADPDLHAGERSNTSRLIAADLVNTFLAALDEEKRLVFVLSEVEGMTAPEIADCLELNINTVYARLRAARLRFERVVDRLQAEERREAALCPTAK